MQIFQLCNINIKILGNNGKRINIAQTEPQLYKAMYGLEAATAKTELSKL